ncbi:MAG: polysaccharide deacetylase family protein [Oscillospiraceae bacterium]
MKQRIISILLAAILLVSMSSTAIADGSGICFTATNDTLLELSSMPVYVSGNAYVPAKVFSTFGVYYDYFEPDEIAHLYCGNIQIYFELSTGNSYDGNNIIQSVSAFLRNGTVYVPVAWICSYFGLYYSSISGNGNGDIIRIKNGGEVMSDNQFLDAATSLMHSRYNEYFGKNEPSQPSIPTAPTPTTSPNADLPDRSAAGISLCFIGLPSKEMLDAFDKYSLLATFFLTETDANSSPDTIRRIIGSGHSIGVYCEKSPETEYNSAIDAVFDAAQTRPMLASSSAATSGVCSKYAGEYALAYFTPSVTIAPTEQYAAKITSILEASKGFTSVCMTSNENTKNMLPSILQYIIKNRFTVIPLLETLA